MTENNDMFPPATTSDVTLEAKIKELELELRYRWHVYPRMVEDGRMNQQDADRRILVIEAILEDLNRYQQARQASA